jgi:hypothetical protein
VEEGFHIFDDLDAEQRLDQLPHFLPYLLVLVRCHVEPEDLVHCDGHPFSDGETDQTGVAEFLQLDEGSPDEGGVIEHLVEDLWVWGLDVPVPDQGFAQVLGRKELRCIVPVIIVKSKIFKE